MADQEHIEVTTMYHARCSLCKAVFIHRKRAEAIRKAEECLQLGIRLQPRYELLKAVGPIEFSRRRHIFDQEEFSSKLS